MHPEAFLSNVRQSGDSTSKSAISAMAYLLFSACDFKSVNCHIVTRYLRYSNHYNALVQVHALLEHYPRSRADPAP